MTEKILVVDDEQNLLNAIYRQLRKSFQIDTALGPEQGLTAVENKGPYAVVISDLRMPAMDGIQFLARVKQINPETVRMMLTGNADLEKTIQAVNEGNIFRFFTKPCPPEILAGGLRSGIEQYQLVTAERELLQ
ncbi:MAG: response regulator, partial [Deltaproteobacteria bacterium]|nr:response regulator [Deltaproteobacteria bacterium]